MGPLETALGQLAGSVTLLVATAGRRWRGKDVFKGATSHLGTLVALLLDMAADNLFKKRVSFQDHMTENLNTGPQHIRTWWHVLSFLKTSS